MNELFVLPTYVKERKRNETLATFPLQAIIKVVSSIGSDEVPAHFVLDAAKELVVRASVPGCEEEFYDEGGVSAVVDLLIEAGDDEKILVEALNVLINLSVSQQGAFDVETAGILMYIVALLADTSKSPLIQVKAAWLLIHLTQIHAVREQVHDEGIAALISMIQSKDYRVQKMAIKALNNVLTDCTPFNNHLSVINVNGVVTLMRIMLTTTAEHQDLLPYALNILSFLSKCDEGLAKILEGGRGVKVLMRTLTVYIENDTIASIIISIVKEITEQLEMAEEILELISIPLFLQLFVKHNMSTTVDQYNPICTNILLIFLSLISFRDQLKYQFIQYDGANTICQALQTDNLEIQSLCCSIIAKLGEFDETKQAVIDNFSMQYLIELLSSVDVRVQLNTLSAIASLLPNGIIVDEIANSPAVENLFSSLASTSAVLRKTASKIFLHISDNEKIKQIAQDKETLELLLDLLDKVDPSLQVTILTICSSLVKYYGNVEKIKKCPNIKLLGTFFHDINSSNENKRNLGEASRALLLAIKTQQQKDAEGGAAALAKDKKLREERAAKEKERLEKEREEQERLEKERLEREEAERKEIERQEQERLENERLEKERQEKERKEKERLKQEQLEQERLELERAQQYSYEPEPLPPSDSTQKQMIDRLAELVVNKGDHIEDQAIQKHADNVRFAFLFVSDSEEYIYYDWKKRQLRKALDESIEAEKWEKLRKEGELLLQKAMEEEKQAALEQAAKLRQEEEARRKQEEEERKISEEERIRKEEKEREDSINDLQNLELEGIEDALSELQSMMDADVLGLSSELSMEELMKTDPEHTTQSLMDLLDQLPSATAKSHTETLTQSTTPSEPVKKSKSRRESRRKSESKDKPDKDLSKTKSSSKKKKPHKKDKEKEKKEKISLPLDLTKLKTPFTPVANPQTAQPVTTPTSAGKTAPKPDPVTPTNTTPTSASARLLDLLNAPVAISGPTETKPAGITLSVPVANSSRVSPRTSTRLEAPPSSAPDLKSYRLSKQISASLAQKKIIKCTFEEKVVTMRVYSDIPLKDLFSHLATKYHKDHFDGHILKYKDDAGDLIVIESQDDLEVAFELCEKRLDLFLHNPVVEVVVPEAPPPPVIKAPAPAPPVAPPLNVENIKVRPNLRANKLQNNEKRMSIKDEMRVFKLKKTNRDLSSLTIRKRKQTPQSDPNDVLGLLMKAMDSRRAHIQEDTGAETQWDEDDWE